ncbi:MAG: FGGY family carbohydrate kinase [Arachidicoccus sp.]|nr:FGGY family carbohydrate kinase [Arachidicoccus sp.]
MEKIPVAAIFDIGKTNKKIFLFDEHYNIVYEKSDTLPETVDEDGFPCENINSLREFMMDAITELLHKKQFDLRALNISTYGASFVYIGKNGKPVAPLYNYLKPYPKELEDKFYSHYGGRDLLALETASPCSGSLNSGLQLYRIKHEKPKLFDKINYALHLPQYLSSLITGAYYSDITSIGCHTHLWDFQKKDYHAWVYKEQLDKKLPPIFPSDKIVKSFSGQNGYSVGVGLHDSSAALIPYLSNFNEPFILISTGTWCISLNPFNQTVLTQNDIDNHGLCYLSYKGTPIKASRLFAGYKHEQETKRIAQHFNIKTPELRNIYYDEAIVDKVKRMGIGQSDNTKTAFAGISLSNFLNEREAYHALMAEIAAEQYISTKQIIQEGNTRKIFVDGGFSKNDIFMHLLAKSFPETEVYAASMAQATALGTALSIHPYWNERPLPNDIIDLKFYSALKQEKV